MILINLQKFSILLLTQSIFL